MVSFVDIVSTEPMSEVIKSAFDMDLDVSGGWGYDVDSAISISSTTAPLAQTQYTIASMRTHIEMSMTLPADLRYGGINLQELSRDTVTEDVQRYERVTYQVKAMLESDYARFISEYKKGYGTPEFDMATHFQQREESTLIREIALWTKL